MLGTAGQRNTRVMIRIISRAMQAVQVHQTRSCCVLESAPGMELGMLPAYPSTNTFRFRRPHHHLAGGHRVRLRPIDNHPFYIPTNAPNLIRSYDNALRISNIVRLWTVLIPQDYWTAQGSSQAHRRPPPFAYRLVSCEPSNLTRFYDNALRVSNTVRLWTVLILQDAEGPFPSFGSTARPTIGRACIARLSCPTVFR